jgi:hypothetical protein
MSSLDSPSMDFVRELRLRQWSRQNFVPAEARKSTWHPVVLDEMSRRDRELQGEVATQLTNSVATTVKPAPVMDTQPKVIIFGIQTEFDGERPHESGWSFLPLDSTAHGEFYPVNMGITRPLACVEDVGSSLSLRFTCLTQII